MTVGADQHPAEPASGGIPAAPLSGAPDDPRVIAAMEEYCAAVHAGRTPEREAFLARHADVAEELAKCLDGLEFVCLAAPQLSRFGEERSAVPNDEVQPSAALGDFQIVREIGRGGMGIVYEAVQLSLGRRVALKVLPFAAALDAKQLQRFKNEAQAAAHLQHTNIVPVYYVGCERGVHFYAMQYIDGQTLAAVIRELRGNVQWPMSTHQRGPKDPSSSPKNATAGAAAQTDIRNSTGELPWSLGMGHSSFFRTVAQLAMQAAEALEHAHQLGVIHRDIKPANLLVDQGGRLWITDFGLAHCRSQPALTMTGDLLGTLRYMSPEQALAKRVAVDARTDLYSLGVTLYELLTLEPAYNGRNREEVLRQIAFEEPAPLSRGNPPVPRDLETIVMKAMAKHPEERYAAAQELADDLRRFLEDKPIKARRPSLWQRAVKWARRHKTLVRSAAVGMVLATVALAVSTMLIWRTNQELQLTLYFQRIALAEREWAANDHNRMEQLLADCPAELRGWEWHYLRRLGHSEVTVLHHESAALSVAFSPDGRRLASGCQDGTVRIWDTFTWRLIRSFVAHPNSHVRCVDFSPDGRRLATSGWDGTAKVWDVETGRPLCTLPGNGLGTYRVLFSSDGRWLAGCSYRHDPALWDANTYELRFTLEAHQSGVRGLAFSPDGSRLASASHDHTLKIWELTSGRELLSLSDPDDELYTVAFSPDGRRVAAAGGRSTLSGLGGDITVWDTVTGEQLLRLRGLTNTVFSLAYSPDGRRLASGGVDKVKVWDMITGKEALTLHGHYGFVFGVAFSPDGYRIASAADDGTVRIWDATPLDRNPGEEVLTLRGHSPGIYDVAFTPDGERLVSGSEDGTVRFWDTTTGKVLLNLDRFGTAVRAIALSPDRRWLAAVCQNNHLSLFAMPDGQQALVIPDANDCSVAFSPDSRLIATGGMKQTQGYPVKVWDVSTGRQRLSLLGHNWVVYKLAFSPDGRRLASASFDWTVKIWDIDAGQELRPLFAFGSPTRLLSCLVSLQVALTPSVRTLRGHTAPVWAAAFSPNGDRLASAGLDGTAKIWNTKTWQVELTLRDRTGGIISVAFSPDGRRLATGGTDSTLKVWDLATGELLHTFHGHNYWVHAVAFSPDGCRLASGSLDGTVKLWPAGPWPKSPAPAPPEFRKPPRQIVP